MIGRAVWRDPYYWRCVDPLSSSLSRLQVLAAYADYADRVEAKEPAGQRSSLLRAIMNLFHSQPNGSKFKRILSEGNKRRNGLTTADVIRSALKEMTVDEPRRERVYE